MAELIFGLARRHYADLAQLFSRHPLIEQVLIFGSRAKGNAKPYSDFDLAVMAPAMDEREFSQIWNEVDALPWVFKIDLLHWDRLGNEWLKEKIIREGKPFYPEENGE